MEKLLDGLNSACDDFLKSCFDPGMQITKHIRNLFPDKEADFLIAEMRRFYATAFQTGAIYADNVHVGKDFRAKSVLHRECEEAFKSLLTRVQSGGIQ